MNNLDEMKELSRRLQALMEDPHPGLMGWNMFLKEVLDGIVKIYDPKYQEYFEKGVKLAADIADDYNSSSIHPYMLGDCIMCKLNITGAKNPRKNSRRLTGTVHLSKS